jgi:hypothetical protein
VPPTRRPKMRAPKRRNGFFVVCGWAVEMLAGLPRLLFRSVYESRRVAVEVRFRQRNPWHDYEDPR